jgi:hypothetical protein
VITTFLTIWASPVIIVNAIVALLFWIFGQISFVGIRTDKRLPYIWAWLFYVRSKTFLMRYMTKKKWAGLAGGNIIVIRKSITKTRPAVLSHELRHVWQMFVFGIFKPIFYTLITGFNRLRYDAKLGYFLNPFEQDAYRFSGEGDLLQRKIDRYKN